MDLHFLSLLVSLSIIAVAAAVGINAFYLSRLVQARAELVADSEDMRELLAKVGEAHNSLATEINRVSNSVSDLQQKAQMAVIKPLRN